MLKISFCSVVGCFVLAVCITLLVSAIPYSLWGLRLQERIMNLEDKVAMYEEIINDDNER